MAGHLLHVGSVYFIDYGHNLSPLGNDGDLLRGSTLPADAPPQELFISRCSDDGEAQCAADVCRYGSSAHYWARGYATCNCAT